MKRGPKYDLMDNLRKAAVAYGQALEFGDDDMKTPWDNLRKAAVRYRDEPKPRGRPPNEDRD
jgi:hypothetical protein